LSRKQESILDFSVLSYHLLSEQEVAPRARVLAHFVADCLSDSAVNVYTTAHEAELLYWAPKGTFGEVGIHDRVIDSESGLLGQLMQDPSPILRSGAALKREDYPHIDVRRTLRSLCYVPLIKDESLVGAIEILSFDGELTEEAVEALQPAAQLGAMALASAQSYEEERHGTLTSISRITQMYDLEKAFSSTLEMGELLPLIGSKFLEILSAEAINIWLLHPDETLELMHQNGEDSTSFRGEILQPGEGVVGAVSNDGEPVCVSVPDDARLVQRNAPAGEAIVRSLLAAAIMDKGALVGVVEAVNKSDGTAFGEDDLFILTSLNETASTALHNASLLMAERKVEVLETLNTVSHEITSTLNLERMLQTIVNAPQAVIPYERAALALERHGHFKLSAVTGLAKVEVDSPELAPLNEVLQWAALSSEVVHVSQRGEEIDADREETRAKFRKYFAESGMRGFYAMPLNDDTGRVGMLALESSDPDFLSSAHLEILQVLTSQATVALRNAQMYKEVPFISVLEPVLVRKRKFMAMQKRRRALIVAGAIAALIFFVAVPLPLRVDGDAVVAPLRQAEIQPETDGVISKVLVKEGQSVHAGQVVAEMEDWNAQSGVAEAQSRYQEALFEMNHALATDDGTTAGVQRVQAQYWKSELDRARVLLDKSQLRSPIDGVIATPHVEDFAGRKLGRGDSFAEVVDASKAVVDVAASEDDAGLLRVGQPASVKLNSYPTRTFHGEVAIVSPEAQKLQDSNVFYSRVAIPNPAGLIRTGMQGRGKIRVGWRPAGYVFFRGPFFWAYSKLWYWFGW
jgi:RND family efflux transporter MFP subunit